MDQKIRTVQGLSLWNVVGGMTHIFGYLKAHQKRNLGFYPAHPAINENRFQKCDWTEFYRNVEEAIPGNMPVSRGNFIMTLFFKCKSWWWHWDETISDRHTVVLQQCANNLIRQEAELSWVIKIWIRDHCDELYIGENIGIALQAAHVWG